MLRHPSRLQPLLPGPNQSRRLGADAAEVGIGVEQGLSVKVRLGQLETVGLGWELVDQYVERLSAVTPEQVREVARKYLVPEVRTVARLDPLPMDAAGSADAPALTSVMGAQSNVR